MKAIALYSNKAFRPDAIWGLKSLRLRLVEPEQLSVDKQKPARKPLAFFLGDLTGFNGQFFDPVLNVCETRAIGRVWRFSRLVGLPALCKRNQKAPTCPRPTSNQGKKKAATHMLARSLAALAHRLKKPSKSADQANCNKLFSTAQMAKETLGNAVAEAVDPKRQHSLPPNVCNSCVWTKNT